MRVASLINSAVKFEPRQNSDRLRKFHPGVSAGNLGARRYEQIRENVSSKSDSAVARFSGRESNLLGPRKIGISLAQFTNSKAPGSKLSLPPPSPSFVLMSTGSCITAGKLVTVQVPDLLVRFARRKHATARWTIWHIARFSRLSPYRCLSRVVTLPATFLLRWLFHHSSRRRVRAVMPERIRWQPAYSIWHRWLRQRSESDPSYAKRTHLEDWRGGI